MGTDAEQKQTQNIETKGIPSVYCNHAITSLSYSEVRVYLSEISPNELVVNPTGTELVQKKPNVDVRFSLVLSPEFARSLANALLSIVEKYESVFGPLRPEP